VRVVACVVIAVLSGAAPVGAKATTFRLTSPAFADGGTIPDGFTCKGENASPPLRWRGVPRRTVELALIVDDPDAASGTFVHWVAWALDPAARSLPEQTVPASVIEGDNGARRPGYTGPCPPPGTGSHHYRFTLYALRTHVTLAPGATADELRAAIRGTVVARARLVGRFGA